VFLKNIYNCKSISQPETLICFESELVDALSVVEIVKSSSGFTFVESSTSLN
jgi:hypothetical protein